MLTICPTEILPFHVTVYSIEEDTERSEIFGTQQEAEAFISTADADPLLVVIEYNFISTV